MDAKDFKAEVKYRKDGTPNISVPSEILDSKELTKEEIRDMFGDAVKEIVRIYQKS